MRDSLTALDEGSAAKPRCLESASVSDFSSKSRMQHNGWTFGWDDESAFKPSGKIPGPPLDRSAYWGCSSASSGELALVLQGRGWLRLNFGNAAGPGGGPVTVELTNRVLGTAKPGEHSINVTASFRENDILKVVESTGVIVISSVEVHCGGSGEGEGKGKGSSKDLTPRGAHSDAGAHSAERSDWHGDQLSEKERLDDMRSLKKAQQMWQTAETTKIKSVTKRLQHVVASESKQSEELEEARKNLLALQQKEMGELEAAKQMELHAEFVRREFEKSSRGNASTSD